MFAELSAPLCWEQLLEGRAESQSPVPGQGLAWSRGPCLFTEHTN